MDSDKSIIVMGDPPPSQKKSKLYWIIGTICVLLVFISSIFLSKDDAKKSEIAKETVSLHAVPEIAVLFNFDSSELSETAKTILREWVITNRNAINKGVLHIEGHADDVGGENYNVILSKKRSESVYKYISHDFGLELSNVRQKGFGATHPISEDDSDKGKNRRVELFLTSE